MKNNTPFNTDEETRALVCQVDEGTKEKLLQLKAQKKNCYNWRQLENG